MLALDVSAAEYRLSDLNRPAIVLALHAPLEIRALDSQKQDKGELATLSIPRGGVVLFPGDLASRGVSIELGSAANSGPAYLATVGPDF